MNLLIAHGGGPTVVINSSLLGAVDAAREADDHLYGILFGAEGFAEEKIIDLTAIPYGRLEKLSSTPASALGSTRHRIIAEDMSRIADCMKKYHIDGFMYNGGNDSMETCHSIYRMFASEGLDTKVIGIPKTMDNDLVQTDHCPGYGSAARYAVISSMELAMEAAALPSRVVIAEFMGRNTGWVAASGYFAQKAGICPVLIFLPESDSYSLQGILSLIENEFRKGKGLLVIVSEGFHPEGITVAEKRNADDFGHVMHGGIGQFLANQIISGLGIKARSERPGLLGRCSILHSSLTDRNEAYEIGKVAVGLLKRGDTGCMISISAEREPIYQVDYSLVPLEDVMGRERFFPKAWINGTDVSDEYIRYASPLIGDGLPEYSFFF